MGYPRVTIIPNPNTLRRETPVRELTDFAKLYYGLEVSGDDIALYRAGAGRTS